MALFKIARGPSNALGTLPTQATEGFAYFQPYDGSFYIDIATANAAVIARSTEENASANRIKIAAGVADKVGHTLSINGKSFNGIQNVDVGTIGVGYGGTGKTEWTQYGVIYASATDTLGQVTAAAGGAILVTGNSKAPTWLAAGNAGDILKSNSTTGAPEWIDPTASLTAYKTVKTLYFYAADASGADAPTGTNSVSFNGSADKSISTKTINALNKAGGTMTGTVYFASGTAYYIDNAGCAKFNSLDTTGATNLGSTLGVTGATTLSSTLAVTGATTLNSTLAVKGTATMYHVIPADDNTTYELGSATARWKKLHIGTADTYGSATQPIWWSDGKPAECTSYANAVVKSAGEFTSAQSITLTGDVTGTASSKAGWSIAATAWKLTPHEHDATYVAAATAPTDYDGKLIFTGMKTNATIGITSELTYSYIVGLRGYSSKDGGGSHEFAFNDNAIYHRMSSTGADTWGSWNMLVRSAAGSAVGSATQPVWINSAGIITACTSYANAYVKGITPAGTTGQFWRGDNTWSNTLNDSLYLNGHIYFEAGKNIYFKYNGTYWPVLDNYNNANTTFNACGGGIHIGYVNTPNTYIFYSSDSSTRTKFFEVNSNGAYALTRFGVNGQNTGYNFYVNGSSYFTNTITGDILSAWHLLAGRPSNTTVFTTYCETTTNLHHDNPARTDCEVTYNRFFCSNSDQTTYGPSALQLPVVDQHILSFSIDNGVAYSRHIAFDIRTNAVYVRARTNNTWGNWEQLVRNTGTWGISITGSSASCTGNAATATKLSNTPNNTTTFLRGDNTWSNVLGGAFQANGTITANGGYLKSTLNGNTVTIGSANSSWCHISNSADIPFWFNKTITIDGHCNPYTNNARNLGSTSTEWANTYSRVVYARHFESSGNYTGDYNMYYGYSRCTNHYFYRGTTGGGQAHVATININGVTSNYNLGVAQTNGSDGYGLSLYAGTGHVQNYGIWCGLASKWGNYGAVNNDWNMYFGMAGSGNRGWVFRHTGNGCVASIRGDGVLSCQWIRLATVYGGSWIAGTHDAGVRIVSATTAGAGGYYQGWYSGKTPSGAWSWGVLSGYNDCYFCFGSDANYNAGTNSTANIKFGSNGTVYSAVWNDYAEYRMSDEKEPGRVTAPNKFGIAQRTSERLQANARIVSDTFGIAIGETDKAKTPVGLVGRVLAYPYRSIEEYHVGDCVCSAPNGTVDIMTRDEIKEWPDRIIGFVNEIPDYDIWDGTLTLPGNGKTGTTIDVKGRIWIDIK